MEWIIVKERLPEIEKDVLVIEDGCVCMGSLSSFCKGNIRAWNIQGDDMWSYCVTHWMPLPEPPKEKEEKENGT